MIFLEVLNFADLIHFKIFLYFFPCVEYYAQCRCGHCQSLAPAWKKAATALKGVVSVGAVDADAHKQLAGQYGIRGFPTIKIFGANKNNPEDYQGGFV